MEASLRVISSDVLAHGIEITFMHGDIYEEWEAVVSNEVKEARILRKIFTRFRYLLKRN